MENDTKEYKEVKIGKNIPREVIKLLGDNEEDFGKIVAVLKTEHNVFEIERAKQRYTEKDKLIYGKFLADEIVRKNTEHYIVKCREKDSNKILEHIKPYII